MEGVGDQPRNLRGEPSQDLLGEDLPPDCLSGREYETLQLLVEGLNPTEIGEHLYLFGRDKKFYCIEAATGKTAWVSEEKFGEYWSLVHQGDRVLALDQRGELILFDADPTAFTILDRKKISPKDPTWAHLGVTGDRLMVRSLKGLTVYQWK